MEHNPTGLPVGDRGDHPGAALGEPLQVRPVIERRSELRAVLPHIPELSILHSVERQVDRPQHRRPRRDIRTNLVVIAKVDHRANPVVNHRCPSSRGQPVQRIGTDQRTPPRLPAVDRGQPAEIAGVEAALPIQVSSDARAHNTILQPSTTTAAARGVVDAARPPATNPSSPTARRSSRPAAAPPAAVIRLPRITRPRQGNRGLQIPLDVRCVRLPLTAGFRPPATRNHKHSPPTPVELIELDQDRRYDLDQLVDGLDDPPGQLEMDARHRGEPGGPRSTGCSSRSQPPNTCTRSPASPPTGPARSTARSTKTTPQASSSTRTARGTATEPARPADPSSTSPRACGGLDTKDRAFLKLRSAARRRTVAAQVRFQFER